MAGMEIGTPQQQPQFNRRPPGVSSDTSSDEEPVAPKYVQRIKKSLEKQQRDDEGKFMPLAGAGGKDKWRFYTSAIELPFGDPTKDGNAYKIALLAELDPLAEIRCDACDGWGHTAGKKGKKCTTAARLYAMKGSKVMGKMIAPA